MDDLKRAYTSLKLPLDSRSHKPDKSEESPISTLKAIPFGVVRGANQDSHVTRILPNPKPVKHALIEDVFRRLVYFPLYLPIMTINSRRNPRI